MKQLTDQDRAEIIALRNAGNSVMAVSNKLGWSRTTVYMVTTGRDWRGYYSRKRNADYARAYRGRRLKLKKKVSWTNDKA